jgi:hypothetical protein
MTKSSNKSNNILVCYEGNWTNEMDIKAVILTTLEEWERC